ncbi:hypothetical protein IscW_ISCW005811 [Ixodes scapularis]|uniref:Uncharacterized protein n=1 Tax=Ixodes scapularis TaxID=6945 RepID=B7PLN3_IXOSC|nr:hypothetical protein IscW_ISCW005811 [Ixodes scapularis]|eukprot:XP_002434681.1 hypothetical protein IscW_ISCW005811 [Ixodes scapularis]
MEREADLAFAETAAAARLFGFLKLNTPENFKKKALILKGVRHLEQVLISHQQQRNKRTEGADAGSSDREVASRTSAAAAQGAEGVVPGDGVSPSDLKNVDAPKKDPERKANLVAGMVAPLLGMKDLDPKTYCKLGHFQLLLEDYAKGTEPLVHLLYDQMVSLVQKLCGRFMRTESYRSKKGKELPLLQPQSPANWKVKVEVGEDTEAAMSSWEPAEKHAFRLGARSFYIKRTQYLLSWLPFDNAILQGLRCLHPESRERESSSRDLRQLATKLPHVIQSQDVSALMDEYALLQLEPIEVYSSSRVDEHWHKIFEMKKADNSAKFPLLCRVVKALLCIPHGNADLERGLSENRRFLLERARLTIQNVNGIRHIVSYAKRFEGDPTRFSLTPDVIKAVRSSCKRYRERIAAEEELAVKRRRDAAVPGTSDDGQNTLQQEDEPFLYGLGLIYFHYSAYQW